MASSYFHFSCSPSFSPFIHRFDVNTHGWMIKVCSANLGEIRNKLWCALYLSVKSWRQWEDSAYLTSVDTWEECSPAPLFGSGQICRTHTLADSMRIQKYSRSVTSDVLGSIHISQHYLRSFWFLKLRDYFL